MAAFAVLFLIEGAIAIWVHDRFVRPYMWGMCWWWSWSYCFVRIFRPEGDPDICRPMYSCFAVCVEVLQYFRLVEILGLEGCGAARIILGFCV